MAFSIGRTLPILVLLAVIAASGFLVGSGSAKPEYFLTLLGIASGASVVAFQLGEQQRASLALQRENAKQSLKLKVYEQLLEKIEATSETSNRSRGYVYSISAELETYLHGIRWSNDATISGLMKRKKKAANALIELIGQLERWEVSFSSADLFRWAFGSASNDIDASFSEFFKVALWLLPHDKEAPLQQPNITAEKIKTIKERADNYIRKCDDLHCYIHDLIIEAQNELLSNLFDRRVDGRKPLDPQYKVISELNRSELLRHFREGTELGKSMDAARDRVRKRLSESRSWAKL